MAIFITGDTHANLTWSKLNAENFPEQKYLNPYKDYVIVCGDFGGVWDGAKSDKHIQSWYKKKSWTTLFCDGNHENHDLLARYPEIEWHGGRVHLIAPNILHLMRGQVYTISEKKFFVMGGARSTDKWARKEGISWWAGEMPSDEEYDEGFVNLARNDFKVDYIVTHCAPDSYQDYIGQGYYEHDKLTNYLQIIKEETDFKDWFMGHYHQDRDDGPYHVLYNSIKKLVE